MEHKLKANYFHNFHKFWEKKYDGIKERENYLILALIRISCGVFRFSSAYTIEISRPQII